MEFLREDEKLQQYIERVMKIYRRVVKWRSYHFTLRYIFISKR